MKLIHTFAAGFAAFLFVAAANGAEQPIEAGRWITESGNLEVDIAPCGEALCGTIVRVLGNRSMSRSDEPMKAKDAKSPLGMQVLSDFKATGSGEWRGHIYNREDGKTYDCLIELLDHDRLKVQPFKDVPTSGKMQVWRRVEGGAQ